VTWQDGGSKMFPHVVIRGNNGTLDLGIGNKRGANYNIQACKIYAKYCF
jgi:hypothetical protein